MSAGDIAQFVALPLSVAALAISIWTQTVTHRFTTIVQFYAALNELSNLRIQHIDTAHLLELPDSYDQVAATVRAANAESTDAEKHRLVLLERAVALRIFELFEQTVYERTASRKSRDLYRRRFIDEVFAHFTNRLLRNPRLLHMWSPGGGGLYEYFEDHTIRVYEDTVPDAALRLDDRGPFR